jgi:hypothetical protein
MYSMFRVSAADRSILSKSGLLTSLHSILSGGLLSGSRVTEPGATRTNKCTTPSCACTTFKFVSSKPGSCKDCGHTHTPPPRVPTKKKGKPAGAGSRMLPVSLQPSASGEANALFGLTNLFGGDDDSTPPPPPAITALAPVSSSTSAAVAPAATAASSSSTDASSSSSSLSSSISVSISSLSSGAAPVALSMESTPSGSAPTTGSLSSVSPVAAKKADDSNKDPDSDDSESSSDNDDEEDDGSDDGTDKTPKWSTIDLRERIQLEAAAWKVLQWHANQLGLTTPAPSSGAGAGASLSSPSIPSNDEVRALVNVLSSELERALASAARQTVEPPVSSMYATSMAANLLRTAGDVTVSLWLYAKSVPGGEAENILSLTGPFPSKYSAMGRDCIRLLSIDWARPDMAGYSDDGGGIINVRVSGLNDNLSFYTKTLRPRKWAHVAVSIKKDVVTVYVNGSVSSSGQCYSPRILPEVKPTLKLAAPTSGLQVILSPYVVMDKSGQANWIQAGQPEVRFTEQYASQIVGVLARAASAGNSSLLDTKLIQTLFKLLDNTPSTSVLGAPVALVATSSLGKTKPPAASPIPDVLDDPTVHHHPLNYTTDLSGHSCDICRDDISSAHRCSECDFDYCSNCLRQGRKKKSGAEAGNSDGDDDDEEIDEEDEGDDEDYESAGYNKKSSKSPKKKKSGTEEDEDDDLAAALAASLKDSTSTAAPTSTPSVSTSVAPPSDGKAVVTPVVVEEPLGPRPPVSGLLRSHVLRLCRSLFTTLTPSQASSLFLSSSASTPAAPSTTPAAAAAVTETKETKSALSSASTPSSSSASSSTSSPMIDWLFAFITRELILNRTGQPSVVGDAIGVARSLFTSDTNEWYKLVTARVSLLLSNPQPMLLELHVSLPGVLVLVTRCMIIWRVGAV